MRILSVEELTSWLSETMGPRDTPDQMRAQIRKLVGSGASREAMEQIEININLALAVHALKERR
jgi:hypothetical protein